MDSYKALATMRTVAIISPQLIKVVVKVIIYMVIFVVCSLCAIAKQDI
jgi:hypothetical protein